MKKLITLLIFFCPFLVSAQFITTWDTTQSGTSCNSCITIPTFGGGYSYNVDWENDGIIDNFGITGNFTHDYGTPGVYQVAITGAFPRIYIAFQNDRLKILSVDQWGPNPWSTMDRAFHGAQNCENLATDAPNLSNVTTMANCFNSASVWNGDMSNWDVSNVSNFASMFFNASQMNSDIGNWDVSSGTVFASILRGTPFNQDIGNWDMSNATQIAAMFYSASSFNQDISSWDVSNATITLSMFHLANSFNQDISSWDVGNVTNMQQMFHGATAFDQDLGSWDVSNVITMQNMFFFTGLSTANYDATLIGWDAQNLQANVSFFAGSSQYCLGEAARLNMINSDGWNIIDSGLDPACVQAPPLCTNLNSPLDGATNVAISSSINWDAAANTDGYRISVGTSSGGTDIVNNMDLGNVTSYFPAANSLPCASTLFVTITPYHNVNGDAVGCLEESFSTESVVANAGTDVSICNGNNAQLAGSGGVSYSWSPATGLDNANIQNPIASPTATTTYTLTTTNANGCSDTDDVIVMVDALPNPNIIAGTTMICSGESTTLDAGVFDNYIWNLGQTTQVITIAPGIPFTYKVTVTDANGCSNTDEIAISVNPVPDVVASATVNTVCGGASTTIQAAGSGGTAPYTYTWDNGLGAGSSFAVTPTTTTSYNVTITDDNGCEDTDMITIMVNPLPSPSISGNLTICDGETTMLDAGNFSSYNWSNGQTTQTISVNPSLNTDYTVTVTDANGCSNTDLVSVSVNTLPAPNITGNPIICFGESTTLDAGGGFSTYLWSLGQTTQVINIAPGINFNYGVTVTDASGCSNTDVISIIVNPVPEIDVTTSDNFICLGESSTVEAMGSGGTAPYTFTWNNGLGSGSSFTVTPTVTTNYSVTITDANGCTDDNGITVLVNPVPNPSISGSLTICDGETTTLDAGNFSAYDWSNGQTTQTIDVNPSTATAYSVTVTDANGCTNTDIVTVSVDASPTPSITGNLTICDGEITPLNAGNFSAYDWSTGETTQIINVGPSTDTDYTVTVTDANGCTNSDLVSVEVNALPTVETDASSSSICEGEITTIEASGFGGAAPYSFSWDNGLGAGIEFDVEPTVTTTYTVTITDNNGCQNTNSVTVFVDPPPSPSIQGNLTVCEGEGTTLDAGSYSFYDWSTGETTQTIFVNPSADTDYSVTVTDANGCTNFDEVTVFVNSGPSPTISGNLVVCNGTSTLLDAGNYSFYDWSDGQTTQSIVVNPSADTDYSVTVTDINGCTASDLVTVEVNGSLTVNASATDNTVCAGESSTISATGQGGTTPYTYDWDNGLGSGNSFNVTPTSTTSYVVTITDIDGCSNTDMVTIAVNNIATPTISGDSNICAGETTSLSVGSFASYAWSTGETTQSINVNPTSTTSYSVTVTDINGCIGTSTISVAVNNLPSLSISGSLRICTGEVTVLDAGLHNSYMWSTGQTSQTITVNPTSNTSYSVTVSNANGCSSTDLVSVTVDPLPTPAIAGNLNVCFGGSTTLDAGNYAAYLWSTGETTQSIVVNPSSALAYAVTVTDINGCGGMDMVTVSVNQLPVPTIVGDTNICIGESTTLDAGNYSSYAWSNGATTQTITVNPASSASYSVTVTDQIGCSGVNTIAVSVSQISTPVIQGSTILCENGSTILSLTQAYSTYLWNTGSTDSQITVTTAGVYEVTASNADGCTATTSVEIQDESSTVVQVTQNNPLCDGATVSLQAQQGFASYEWSTGSTESEIEITEPGIYEVSVMTNDGCSGLGQIEVTDSEVNYFITTRDESCFASCDGQITLELDAGYSVLWDNGSTQFTEEELCPGAYMLEVFNEDGCSQSIIIDIIEAIEFTASISADEEELTAETQGGVAPFTYLWNTGDTTQVVPAEVGTFDLTITDANGCETTATYIISGTVDHSLSKIKLFPNPVTNILHIELDKILSENISYTIYTTDGQFVQKGDSLPSQINVSDFDQGIYIIQLESSKGIYSSRIIVMH